MSKSFVYIYLSSDGEPIYIGKTNDFSVRDKSHKSTSAWYNMHESVEIIECESDNHALLIEAEKIKEMRPKFNVTKPDEKRLKRKLNISDGDGFNPVSSFDGVNFYHIYDFIIYHYGSVNKASKELGIHAYQLNRWIKSDAHLDDEGNVYIRTKGKLTPPTSEIN